MTYAFTFVCESKTHVCNWSYFNFVSFLVLYTVSFMNVLIKKEKVNMLYFCSFYAQEWFETRFCFKIIIVYKQKESLFCYLEKLNETLNKNI